MHTWKSVVNNNGACVDRGQRHKHKHKPTGGDFGSNRIDGRIKRRRYCNVQIQEGLKTWYGYLVIKPRTQSSPFFCKTKQDIPLFF